MNKNYPKATLCSKYTLYNIQKPILLAWFLTIACLSFTNSTVSARSGQQPIRQWSVTDSVRPLNIGDTIPESLWHMPLQVVNHPEGKDTITLNDYRGKLIILDFWATWCTACIVNFPKMETLQKQFAKELHIWAVTYEPKAKIRSFFSSRVQSPEYQIPSIVNDNILKKAFPHRGIPHCVWIDGRGTVSAITSSEDLNISSIRDAISSNYADLPVKHDIDARRPLFLSEYYPENSDLLYFSVLSKGTFSGLPTGNNIRKTDSIITGRAVTNSDLLSIYEVAMWPLFKELNDYYTRSKLILEVADTSRVMLQYNSVINRADLYNFDIIVPLQKTDSLYHFMLDHLNRFTSFTGGIERRKIKCMILTTTGKKISVRSRGSTPLNTLYEGKPARLINYPISGLLTALNDILSLQMPLVDETGITGKVDIELSGDFTKEIVNKELSSQGLTLKEAFRELNVFVLKDK